YHSKPFGITDAIAKNGSPMQVFNRFFQLGPKALSIKDIIPQNEGYIIIPNKIFAYNKGLGQSIGIGLYGILEINAPVVAITQQPFKVGLLLRGGDDKYFPDPGQHQYRQGVVNHGFIVYGSQLFRNAFGYGVETRSEERRVGKECRARWAACAASEK